MDLLKTTSLDSVNYTDIQKQLTQVLNENDKLECKCQQLEVKTKFIFI